MSFTNPDNNVKQLELKQGSTVIVFGSGAGGHSFAAIRALGGTGHVYAVDVRKDMLDKMRADGLEKGVTGIETIHGNIERSGGTGRQDNSMDAVIIPNTLFMYDDKKAIVTEAKRIVRPDGKIMIVDWNGSYEGMGPRPEDVVPRQTAITLCEEAGLTFVTSFSAGAQHYGLIFTKESGVQETQPGGNAPSIFDYQ